MPVSMGQVASLERVASCPPRDYFDITPGDECQSCATICGTQYGGARSAECREICPNFELVTTTITALTEQLTEASTEWLAEASTARPTEISTAVLLIGVFTICGIVLLAVLISTAVILVAKKNMQPRSALSTYERRCETDTNRYAYDAYEDIEINKYATIGSLYDQINEEEVMVIPSEYLTTTGSFSFDSNSGYLKAVDYGTDDSGYVLPDGPAVNDGYLSSVDCIDDGEYVPPDNSAINDGYLSPAECVLPGLDSGQPEYYNNVASRLADGYLSPVECVLSERLPEVLVIKDNIPTTAVAQLIEVLQ